MRHKLWALTLVAVFMLVPKAQAACTPTGFAPDGPNLTAALINPLVVPATVNATGCDIGIYYTASFVVLNGKEIFGAKSYGVVLNGDGNTMNVNILNNVIHNIGDVPFSGAQHGIGLYFRAYATFNMTGQATGNVVYAYQKGGIAANGKGVRLSKLDNNLVVGLGHINFIAQNGIQVGYGALPYPSEVDGNIVANNSYIGFPGDGSASAGILVVGGPFYACPGGPCPYTKNVLVGINTALNAAGTNYLLNNDIGVFAFNADTGATAPLVPTNVLIVTNYFKSDVAYNTSYIAAISAFGNTDYVLFNTITPGGGYGPSCSSLIDTSGSTNPQVFGNVPATCTASAAASGEQLMPSPAAP